MCQAVPCKVLQVVDERAEVNYEGAPRWVNAPGLPNLASGEYVTVYGGVVLARMSAEEAEDLLRLYAELDELVNAFDD